VRIDEIWENPSRITKDMRTQPHPTADWVPFWGPLKANLAASPERGGIAMEMKSKMLPSISRHQMHNRFRRFLRSSVEALASGYTGVTQQGLTSQLHSIRFDSSTIEQMATLHT